MNLEHRLSDHLLRASAQLEAPPDRLERVVRRGRRRRSAQRGAAALVGVAAVLAAPAMIRGVRGTVVELAPAAPPSVPLTAPPIPNGDVEPQEGQVPASAPASDPAQADGAGLTLTQLPAPVLAFGPYEHDQLRIVSRDEDRTFGVPADAAFPDGQGGVVYQPAGLAELRWSGAAQPLVDLGPGDRRLLLRGLLPGGRVLYSVLPAAQEMVEGSVEEFFALDLAAGAEPVLLTTAGAYERTVVGPAVAAGRRLVHASCHLHCRLWLGLAEPEAEEPLYNGLGIDGLTATPDGAVIAFIEHDPAAPEGAAPPPALVLLDGTSFDELARIALPPQGEEGSGVPTVSLSGDGQRALVGIGASAPAPRSSQGAPTMTGWPGLPTRSYLVEELGSGDARVIPVDFAGVLRWMDPGAASQPAG